MYKQFSYNVLWVFELVYTVLPRSLVFKMMDNWEVLSLTSDDPCRTTLEQKDTKVVSFSSKTDDKKSGSRPLTTFANANGEEIAQLEWHMYFSDKLRLRGGEWVNVGKWIKGKKDAKG